MRYYQRNFGDAFFAYNISTGSAFFIEGPLSFAAESSINSGKIFLPNTLLNQYDKSDQLFIRQDWDEVSIALGDFLNSDQGIGNYALPTNEKSVAFEALSQYAVQNWQLVNVNIELTHQCNQRCRWCYLDDFKKATLSRERLLLLADELYDLHALFALFTGGELFLRSDSIDIMNDFAKKGFVLEIKTNGTLLKDSVIDALSDLPLLDIQISIYEMQHGWSDNTQSFYPFKKIQQSICKMVDKNLPLTLSVLVGKHNIDKIYEINSQLLELGANVYYSPYITPNRSGPGQEISFRLSAEEMEQKFLPFLRSINYQFNQKKYRSCDESDVVCYAGCDQIAIDPFGVVYPCLDLRIPIGSIVKRSLSRVLKHRKDVMNRFTLNEMLRCKSCSIRDYCDSCVGISILEHGDYRKPSQHKCDVIHFYAR